MSSLLHPCFSWRSHTFQPCDFLFFFPLGSSNLYTSIVQSGPSGPFCERSTSPPPSPASILTSFSQLQISNAPSHRFRKLAGITLTSTVLLQRNTRLFPFLCHCPLYFSDNEPAKFSIPFGRIKRQPQAWQSPEREKLVSKKGKAFAVAHRSHDDFGQVSNAFHKGRTLFRAKKIFSQLCYRNCHRLSRKQALAVSQTHHYFRRNTSPDNVSLIFRIWDNTS